MNPEALAATPRRLTHAFEANAAVKGRVQVHVYDPKKDRIIKTMPWQNNLVLDQGMNYYATNTWANLMNYCVAGTGTTPTRDILDGTAGQSGTTVTLTGSTYSFSAGDVGKWIGWASGGYQAKITAYISATTVTVDRSQTVSTATATLYRCNQTGLATEVKRTNTYPVYTYTDGRGASASFASATNVLTLRRTYDFSAETGSVNYTEIGISPIATVASNLFARILLAGAVTVTSGQQLRVTYELAITVNGTSRPSQTLSSSTGWPYTYSISSITGNGTSFTVTTSAAHHYVAGGSITIAGALRTKTAITAASSTSTDFTITANAHGRTTGDSITIAGMTPSGYNGTWTVASTTTNTITVTTAANPGTGTVFGTVRQTEPGTWYNGTWTVASVTSTTIVVTSSISLSAGADGTVQNNLGSVFYLNHWPIAYLGGNGGGYGTPVSPENTLQWNGNTSSPVFYFNGATNNPGSGNGGNGSLDGTYQPTSFKPQLFLKSSAITPPGSFPVSGVYAPNASSGVDATSITRQSYTNGNFYRDILLEWDTTTANSQIIRGFGLPHGQVSGGAIGDAAVCWLFNEPQRKDSTNRLRITFRQSWSRVLA